MRRLLWYGDAPTAATGFGTVSRNVLAALQATKDWSIVVRGVNYYAQGHPYGDYMILPAGYPDPDPFGKKNALRDLATGAFDLVIANNDTYVLADVAGEFRQVCNRTGTKFILYYPVDLKLLDSMAAVIAAADQPVAYSRFGLAETKRLLPNANVAVIPHGSETIPPIDRELRRQARVNMFGPHITDEHFIWICVNRNSMRKDIAHTIEAFAAFHEYEPRSMLYVHCQAQDNGLDMHLAAVDSGVADCVAFPHQYNLSSGGIDRDQLYLRYLLADGFITTHLGEGWGLTVTEAMAANIPVVAPNNTTMPEILGPEYPYLYPCTERVYVDNTGHRPRGSTRDIFRAMRRVYEQRGSDEQKAVLAGSLAFTKDNSWENVGKMWVSLVNHVMATDYKAQRAQPLVETL